MFIAIAIILIVLAAIVAACIFIEMRAAAQDPKYMKIRDAIMSLTK